MRSGLGMPCPPWAKQGPDGDQLEEFDPELAIRNQLWKNERLLPPLGDRMPLRNTFEKLPAPGAVMFISSGVTASGSYATNMAPTDSALAAEVMQSTSGLPARSVIAKGSVSTNRYLPPSLTLKRVKTYLHTSIRRERSLLV